MAAVRTRAARSQKPSLGRPEPEDSAFPNLAITVARGSFLPAITNNVMRSLICIPRSDQPAFILPSGISAGTGQENPDADGWGPVPLGNRN
jgi:hypothetical protein